MNAIRPDSAHTDIRFINPSIVRYNKDCIDFRCPTWSMIEKIKEHLSYADRVWCDTDLRVIILYMSVENILYMKLTGCFDD